MKSTPPRCFCFAFGFFEEEDAAPPFGRPMALVRESGVHCAVRWRLEGSRPEGGENRRKRRRGGGGGGGLCRDGQPDQERERERVEICNGPHTGPLGLTCGLE